MGDVFDHSGPTRLVSGGIWFLALMILSGFFWWAFSILISRFYGPVGYGIANTASSLYNFAWVFIFGGLFQGLIKYGSEYVVKSGWKLDSYFSMALKYLTAIGVIMFILLAMLASRITDPIMKIITLTIAASFLFSGTKDALTAMIGSFQKSDHLSIINSSRSIIIFVVSVAFVLLGVSSTMLPTLIIWGTVWQLALSIYFLRTDLIKMLPFNINVLFRGRTLAGKKMERLENFKQFASIFVFGFFISLGMISFNVMKSLDIIVLKMFFDYGDVGIYSVADAASSILFYMTSFSLPVIPAIAEAYARKDKTLLHDYVKIAVKYPLIIGVPLTLIIFAMADPIVVGLYGPAFAEAVAPLQILIIGTFMLMMGYNLSSVLIGVGNSRLSGLLMTIAAAQYILSLFILVPLFGFVGAAMSLTLTGLTSILLVPYYLKKKLGVSIYNGVPRVLMAAAAMALVLFAFPKSNILFVPVGIGVSVAVFFVLLRLMGYVTSEDLRMMRTAGRSFRPKRKR
jgi:O-antigen/teichoic acid export membrane protein